MRGSHREKDKEKNRFWLKVLTKFWAKVSYKVSISVAHLVLATCPQLVRQPAQNVCKAYQSGNSFCFALCYCSSLLSLSISYCRFIKISRIIADTKALYTSTSTHSSHFLCQLFFVSWGGTCKSCTAGNLHSRRVGKQKNWFWNDLKRHCVTLLLSLRPIWYS